MGYTTYFTGQVAIEPPLNPEEISFLRKFNETRRMDRIKGPYFVAGSGDMGQGRDDDIKDFNSPPLGQPGLWCQWTPTKDGRFIEWDEGEKFYHAPEWMMYLIEHFLKPGCIAAQELPFLQANHTLNGEIEALGEARDDSWAILVEDNIVKVLRNKVTTTAQPAEPVTWDVISGRGKY